MDADSLPIPTDLHATGRAAFTRAIAAMTALGDNPSLSYDAIVRYAHSCDAEKTARDAWEIECRAMLALGSQKSLVAHPLTKAVRDAEVHAGNMAKAIGLTPEARAGMGKRVGQPMGQSHAPDRQGLKAA